MKIRLIALGTTLVALFAGCGTEPARTQRLAEVRTAQAKYVNDKDVQRRVNQAAAHVFPEVYAFQKQAAKEGRMVTAPRLLTTVRPKYPFSRRAADVQGFVWIGFVVDESGATTRVTAIPDETGLADPLFVASAADAVQQWKFEPGKVDGQPMRFALVVPVIFQLE
jgi:TonB family protein